MAIKDNNRKITIGTKEWADSNVNCYFGCSNNCRYCYAKKMAIRFKRKTSKNWKIMIPNQKYIDKDYKKRKGRIMFPTSHDITEENLKNCLIVLKKLIRTENDVLITTKPRLKCILKICETFNQYKKYIQFRFTITSLNNNLLKFWEEGAPTFKERLESLKYAYFMKFKTSVSIEPFLDRNPIFLITKLYPYVSDTIWLGKMNYIDRNNIPSKEKKYFREIRKNFTNQNLQRIINSLINYKKIRYKDSIKKMNLNIPYFQSPEVKL